MGHYQENREASFVSKSSTPEAEKDSWQTPEEIFDALDNEFDFDLDVCASDENNLVRNFFTKHRSALEYEWIGKYEYDGIKTAFMNPPYSQTELFLKRASEQAKKHNITIVALVNANTDTKWFKDAVATANEVRLISGRIGFVKPNGSTGKSQNTKGQCLIIWRGNCKTPCQITLIDRDMEWYSHKR